MTSPLVPVLADLAPGAAADVADSADRRLLARLQRGEERAFEELVRANTHRLLAVARRLLRNEEDAQEVVQDGMILALRALSTFRGDCLLSTWLHRIVVNSALMRLRSRKRRPETSIEDLLPTFLADGHQASPAPEWTDVERALEIEETRSLVRAAIDHLPPSYRTVLLLRDIEELDTPTVAGLLGASPNAVKIRVHRARQALARLLAPVFVAE